MSIVGAPLPPEPIPWENNEYEDNLEPSDSDDEQDDNYSLASDTEYESDTYSEKSLKIKKSKHIVPYYRTILQEEEYFSE